jgi:hypothetical protein
MVLRSFGACARFARAPVGFLVRNPDQALSIPLGAVRGGGIGDL